MPYLNRRRYHSLALFAALATLVLAACSSGAGGTSAGTTYDGYSRTVAASTAAPAAGAAAAGAGSVTIKDFAFSPTPITIAAGTTVTWTNNDAASHTVTAVDGSFDSKPIASGATFSQAFPKAGTYTYHCTIHSSMTGTVVVQ